MYDLVLRSNPLWSLSFLTKSPKLEKVNPIFFASSLATTVFPTPGVPVTIMILGKVCSGAPAGTLRHVEAFEPGSPDRESGILSAMCRPVYTTGADAPGKYVSVKSVAFPEELDHDVAIVAQNGKRGN